MLDVVCNAILRCGKNVLKLHNLLLYMDRKIDRIYNHVVVLPSFSDIIANYMKEVHITKCNRRGDVVMQCHHH